MQHYNTYIATGPNDETLSFEVDTRIDLSKNGRLLLGTICNKLIKGDNGGVNLNSTYKFNGVEYKLIESRKGTYSLVQVIPNNIIKEKKVLDISYGRDTITLQLPGSLGDFKNNTYNYNYISVKKQEGENQYVIESGREINGGKDLGNLFILGEILKNKPV